MAQGFAPIETPARAEPVKDGLIGKDKGKGKEKEPVITSLSPDAALEMKQFEQLLRFRDKVVGGLHPRIKPPNVPAKSDVKAGDSTDAGPLPTNNAIKPTGAPSTAQPAVTQAPTNGTGHMAKTAQSFQANMQRPPVTIFNGIPGLDTLSSVINGALSASAGAPKPAAPVRPEINPILLEKSDELIRAELQIQRKRLEASLREQMEQHRASSYRSSAEQLAELDIADVMARALSLVQATSPAQPADETAANARASSDSSDNDTFYSSRHDTPESVLLSRVPDEPEAEDEEMRDGSPYEPELDPEPVSRLPEAQQPPPPPPQPRLPQSQQQQQGQGPSSTSPSAPVPSVARPSVPGLLLEAPSQIHKYPAQGHVSEVTISRQSGTGSRSGGFSNNNTRMEQAAESHDPGMMNRPFLSQALSRHDTPVVRAHNLTPIAPQPEHVSALAVARQDAITVAAQGANTLEASSRRATPAQVAALRKQLSAATSPESSPHGSKPQQKKTNKKKKRKAERRAAEAAAAASPHVKSEPRSPSPLTAPPFARPAKRQRQSQRQPAEINPNEPRHNQPAAAEDRYQDQDQPRVLGEERIVGYERAEEPYPSGSNYSGYPSTALRYERGYHDDGRPLPSARPLQPDSPSVHPAPLYPPREVRTVRAASHAVADSRYREPAAGYYQDARSASRMSMRPAAYRDRSRSPVMYERSATAVGPAKPPPRRIVVDEYGREYVEPARPVTVIREPIGPEALVPDAEVIYERTVPVHRAVSRRPDMPGQEAVVYRPPSPSYPAPRRVVTQPEYAPDYRAYRERDYSMAPPSGEYVPSRARLEGRTVIEQPSREYIARATSVRPPVEPVRYEPPSAAGYERRVAAPEEPSRDFFGTRAASVRPPETVARYEVPVGGYERRVVDEPHAREYVPLRPASVRPGSETVVRYEAPREYGGPVRIGSVRPEMQVPLREYVPPPSVHQDARREQQYMQPPPAPPPQPAGRSYSVVPPEAPPQQVVRQDYTVRPGDRGYYGRQTMPTDDNLVYLDRPTRDLYRDFQ
ncbi:hypothetical protein QBC46DRAFT_313147 [Diplogelasinospora grovesii]|uniref:Uncharacterized protein n=1 Tax=Diplogelasinospora grovesii TaxID=303347 RepID=A0AAN6N8L3_9PEZI|nr:hypothetical protein QBC46DRAFT_313147 [Diplogelasinospora grovesii]